MRFYITIILLLLITLGACSKKKAISIQSKINSNLYIIKDSIIRKDEKEDSSTIFLEKKVSEEQYLLSIDSFVNQKIPFCTFSAEVQTQYSDNNNQQFDFNLFLRIKKDSLIWLSMEVFGIEIFRVTIDSKGLIILDKFSKTARILSFEKIENLLGFPLDFNLLQNIIIGNSIELNKSYKNIHKQEEEMSFSSSNNYMQSIVKYILTKKELNENILTTIKDEGFTTCNIYLYNYKRILDQSSFNFSFNRHIIIKGKVQSIINLSFKNIKRNENLSFPFSIPKNYTINTAL